MERTKSVAIDEINKVVYKEQQLPAEFAGRVLKLEMQIDKGVNYVTVSDINNLMDLYT